MKVTISILSILFLSFTLCGQNSGYDFEVDSLEWELVPFPEVAKGGHIFAEHNGRLWVADGHLYFSDDNGDSWEQKPEFSNVVNIFEGSFGLVVVGRYRVYGNLYYSDYLTFSISQDGGESFYNGTEQAAYSASMHGGYSLVGLYQVSDSMIIYHGHAAGNLGSNYVVKSSKDGGATWESQYSLLGFPTLGDQAYDFHQGEVFSLKLSENSEEWEFKTKIFQADTIFTTTNFFQLPDGYDFEPNGYRFFVRGGNIYILFSDGQMIYGNHLEEDWTILNYPFTDLNIQDVKFFDEEFQVNTPGQLWEVHLNDLSEATLVFESETQNQVHFNKTTHYNFASDNRGVYLKNPNSSAYTFSGRGINYMVSAVAAAGEVIWVKLGEWFRSGDYCQSWSSVSNTPLTNGKVISDFNNIFYVKKENTLYRSLDNGHNWEVVTFLNGADKFVATEEELFVYDRTHLYHSTDGINFTARTNPRVGPGELIIHNNKIIFITENSRYLSTDNGNTWLQADSAEENPQSDYFSSGEVIVRVEKESSVLPINTSVDEGYSWLNQRWFYPIFTASETLPGTMPAKIDSLLFINANSFMVTQNIGQTVAKINSPFYQIATRFGDTRPGPSDLFRVGNQLYGFSTETNFYRTSIMALKNQLPKSFDPRHPQISGHLYKDLNNSCTFDAGDIPLANKVIRFRNDYLATDQNGFYTYYHQGDHAVSYLTDTIRNTEMLCSNLNQGDSNAGSIYDTIDIAFHPIPDLTDGGILIYSTDIFKPDQKPIVKIKVTNFGSQPIEDEHLEFNFNNHYQFVAEVSNGILLNDSTWQFTVTLAPGEETTLFIEMYLNEDLAPETHLVYSANLELSEDVYPADNLADYSPNVTASDINQQKKVHPDTVFSTQRDVDITYHIHFQNTGIDTAKQVTVIDTLSNYLDIYSFEMIESSHPYRIEIEKDSVIKWIFEDINLPDKLTNNAASQGYLTFKIKNNRQLFLNQEIFNDASIYFDTNEPVLTNEVVTTVKKQTTVILDSLEICYGDRFNDSFITGDRLFSETVSTPDYDTIYQTFVTALPVYSSSILIFAAPGDLIEGIAVYSDTIIRHELLSIHNCDSIVSFLIKMTTTGISDLDNANFNASVHPNPSNGTAQLILNLSDPATLSATWFTATGQQLLTAIHHQPIPDGRHEIPLDLSDFTAGIYFLKIETRSGVKWIKVVKK